MENKDLLIDLTTSIPSVAEIPPVTENKEVVLENSTTTDTTLAENTVATPVEDNSFTLEKLTPDEQKFILDFAKKINLDSSDEVIQYGYAAQNKIAVFCENVLKEVKTNRLDVEVANTLTDLAAEIDNFDVSDKDKGGLISGIFKGINKTISKAGDATENLKHQISLTKKEITKMQLRYEDVDTTINKIVTKLEDCKVQLVQNIAVMNKMYDQNLSYYKELTLYVIAGKERLKTFDTEIEAQRKISESSNDQMEIQKLNEMTEIKNKFEQKLDDLIRSRLVSIQNAPQIRLVQNGSEQLVYQIQNSILTSIPIWKSQMVISLGIASNKVASGVQKQINQTTNDILRRNSELLKQGSIEIAEESGKGVVTVETLQKTNADLIETINSVMQIQKTNAENRKVAEKEVIKLENELKQTLLNSSK